MWREVGIAFASVLSGANKNQAPQNWLPANTPVVVATAHDSRRDDRPADGVGGLVAIQLIPQRTTWPATDLTLQGLTDQVLTSTVQKGHAIQTTQLDAQHLGDLSAHWAGCGDGHRPGGQAWPATCSPAAGSTSTPTSPS